MVTGEEIGALRARLEAANSVCVLTGSGLGAESGLPEGFAREPQLVRRWYDERRRRARPSDVIPLLV
jgi:NAD-dependent SIR2 family protein deacetylase